MGGNFSCTEMHDALKNNQQECEGEEMTIASQSENACNEEKTLANLTNAHFKEREERRVMAAICGPYPNAESQICVTQHWMKHTITARYLEIFEGMFRDSPQLLNICTSYEAHAIITAFCSKGKKSVSRMVRFYESRGNQKKYLALAFLLMLKYQSSDGIFSLLERMEDHARRCESAKRHALVFAVKQAGALLMQPAEDFQTCWDEYIPEFTVAEQVFPVGCDGNPEAKAHLNRIHECVEFYLDQHKEKAFMSALHEPARYYYHICGNTHHRDHVNVHGLNGYLCLVRGGLECALPIVPMENDGDTFKGCGDHWKGLKEEAWTDHFSKRENFGKAFEGIRGLRNGRKFLKNSKYGQYNNRNFSGRNASTLETRAKNGDDKLKLYMERFSHFFTQEFLVRGMFETMNAEMEPEYAGFRNACEDLFPLYKEKYDLEEETLLEYLYDDMMFNLEVDRVTDFFHWLGICK